MVSSLGVVSSFTFGLLRPKIFRPFSLIYYVGFGEEQIGSRRGCGVNGGLKVTILLGCMKGSCQEASRTCSRVRAVCVAIDLIVGQVRWGGKRRGQTNQGFFSVALEALLNIWHRQPKIESQRIFQPRLFGHFAFFDVCLLFLFFVFLFFVYVLILILIFFFFGFRCLFFWLSCPNHHLCKLIKYSINYCPPPLAFFPQ